jgi:hypothetical protein
MLLIEKAYDEHLDAYPNERSPCSCHGGLSLSDLLPEFVTEGDLQQFLVGLYCEACGLGFIPAVMAKPARQAWRLTELGWHPVKPDGSLGPPQSTMTV